MVRAKLRVRWSTLSYWGWWLMVWLMGLAAVYGIATELGL